MDRKRIELVDSMQKYLIAHAEDENFTLEEFYSEFGYSRRQADRVFSAVTKMTPNSFLTRLRMTKSASLIAKGKKDILDVALLTHDTHEGYTRAFVKLFHALPSEYKKGNKFIPLFVPYSPLTFQKYLKGELKMNETKTCLCMIAPVEKPKRKLVYIPAKSANDYWSFCEEVGCDWEGLLNSIPSKMCTAAILTLPPALILEGYGSVAAGVEVPADFEGIVPENAFICELPPCTMLEFESEKPNSEEEFFAFLGELFKAVENFDYVSHGFKVADEIAPRFNFGSQNGKAAKLSVPVKKQ